MRLAPRGPGCILLAEGPQLLWPCLSVLVSELNSSLCDQEIGQATLLGGTCGLRKFASSSSVSFPPAAA